MIALLSHLRLCEPLKLLGSHDNVTVLHNEYDVLERANIVQRIVVYRNNVRSFSHFQCTNLIEDN